MGASLQDVLASYAAAWSEPDEARRMELLSAAWNEEGVYTDPQVEVRGRKGLSDYIGAVHAKMPGARIAYTSGVSQHHGRINFSWNLVSAEGKPVLKGVDFGRLDDNGRLLRIVGFFGDLPSLSTLTDRDGIPGS